MAFLPPPPLFWPIPLTAGDQMLHECRSSVFAPWRVEWFQEVICIAQPSQHTGFRAEIKVLKSNESFAREPPVCVKRDATRDTDTRLRRKEAGVLFSHGRPGSPGVPTHCEKSGVRNPIRPEACGRHDRETVTQVDGQ